MKSEIQLPPFSFGGGVLILTGYDRVMSPPCLLVVTEITYNTKQTEFASAAG